MTRVYAAEIQVERGMVGRIERGRAECEADCGGADRMEAPVGFTWGGRSYVVHAVLDHWVEAGTWWRSAGRDGRRGGEQAGQRGGQRVAEQGSEGVVLGIDDGEQEKWRVEASLGRAPGSNVPTGVFDLNFDWSSGRWSLIRVHD